MDLFEAGLQARQADDQPLAARLRPRHLDEYIGQSHILGPGRLLRRAIQADQLASLIFYGPPGTGKTTLIPRPHGADRRSRSMRYWLASPIFAKPSMKPVNCASCTAARPSSLSTKSTASTKRNKMPCCPGLKTAPLSSSVQRPKTPIFRSTGRCSRAVGSSNSRDSIPRTSKI